MRGGRCVSWRTASLRASAAFPTAGDSWRKRANSLVPCVSAGMSMRATVVPLSVGAGSGESARERLVHVSPGKEVAVRRGEDLMWHGADLRCGGSDLQHVESVNPYCRLAK